MVRVIMGVKGTGKTKQMIELINTAIQNEHGNVVCIERGPKLTYDINYKIRLVAASHYDMKGYELLQGFIRPWRTSWTGSTISARTTTSSLPSPSAPTPPWPVTA